jgi:hypothetical protein
MENENLEQELVVFDRAVGDLVSLTQEDQNSPVGRATQDILVDSLYGLIKSGHVSKEFEVSGSLDGIYCRRAYFGIRDLKGNEAYSVSTQAVDKYFPTLEGGKLDRVHYQANIRTRNESIHLDDVSDFIGRLTNLADPRV